jgi:hypothetical protein
VALRGLMEVWTLGMYAGGGSSVPVAPFFTPLFNKVFTISVSLPSFSVGPYLLSPSPFLRGSSMGCVESSQSIDCRYLVYNFPTPGGGRKRCRDACLQRSGVSKLLLRQRALHCRWSLA